MKAPPITIPHGPARVRGRLASATDPLGRYILRMYRTGQTHSLAFATWRGDDEQELRRIAGLNAQEGCYFQLNDTETGTAETP